MVNSTISRWGWWANGGEEGGRRDLYDVGGSEATIGDRGTMTTSPCPALIDGTACSVGNEGNFTKSLAALTNI